MKIQRNHVVIEDVDANYPIYSSIEEDYDVYIYTKIEKRLLCPDSDET